MHGEKPAICLTIYFYIDVLLAVKSWSVSEHCQFASYEANAFFFSSFDPPGIIFAIFAALLIMLDSSQSYHSLVCFD